MEYFTDQVASKSRGGRSWEEGGKDTASYTEELVSGQHYKGGTQHHGNKQGA